MLHIISSSVNFSIVFITHWFDKNLILCLIFDIVKHFGEIDI